MVYIRGERVVKEPKTQKSRRTLYISEIMKEKLLNLKKQQDERQSLLGDTYTNTGYVYCNNLGISFKPNTLSEQFTRFIDKHKLKKIRLHDLRHAYASILAEQNVSVQKISESMGHAGDIIGLNQ